MNPIGRKVMYFSNCYKVSKEGCINDYISMSKEQKDENEDNKKMRRFSYTEKQISLNFFLRSIQKFQHVHLPRKIHICTGTNFHDVSNVDLFIQLNEEQWDSRTMPSAAFYSAFLQSALWIYLFCQFTNPN